MKATIIIETHLTELQLKNIHSFFLIFFNCVFFFLVIIFFKKSSGIRQGSLNKSSEFSPKEYFI